MKRILSLLAALAMVISMIPNVFAATTEVAMTVTPDKTELSKGETVTLTVEIPEVADCRSAGIVVNYDEEVLEFVEGTCDVRNTFMHNVGLVDGKLSGVFTYSNATATAGKLFTFVMRVKDAAAFGNTVISFVPAVRDSNGALEVTAADVALNVVCAHDKCAYSAISDTEHKAVCACGMAFIEKHTWDKGVVTEPTFQTEGKITYTCTKCNATKEEVTAPAKSVAMTLTADKLSVGRGEQITFTVSVEEVQNMRSAGFVLMDGMFDQSIFAFVEGKVLVPNAQLGKVGYVNNILTGTMALMKAEDYEGALFAFTMKVKDDAPEGETTITGIPAVRNADGNINVTVNTLTVSVASCNHEKGTYSQLDDQTHVYTCLSCGIQQTGTHNWQLGKIVEATCEAAGSKNYTCADCNATKSETVAALGHAWDNGVVTVMPTCAAEGVKTYTCGNCKNTKTEAIAKLAHAWDAGSVTTKPTCQAEGIKTYTCTGCGETRTEALPKGEHTWDAGTVTAAPTQQSKGIVTYTCQNCAATETEEFDALMTITADKTTLYRGDEVTFTISVSEVESARGAGFSLTDVGGDLYDPNVLEFIDGTCPVPGTFMSNVGVTAGKPSGSLAFGSGTKLSGVIFTFRMKVRDDAPFSQTALSVVPSVSSPEGKLLTVVNTVRLDVVCDHAKSTYTQLDDQNHIYTCQICGEAKSLPHTWDAGTVTVAPTCAAEGVMTFTCADGCGATKTEAIAKSNEHSFGDWIDNGENHKHICAVCGLEEVAEHSCDTTKWESDAENHWHVCICGAKQDVGAHSFTEQIIDDAHKVPGAPRYYYDCAHCDAMSTESFAYGSVDGDNDVDIDDAVYLLQHVLMPELFPVDQYPDFNKDGAVTVDDAIYLLQHVLMPELFPL